MNVHDETTEQARTAADRQATTRASEILRSPVPEDVTEAMLRWLRAHAPLLADLPDD
jgi:hypothetical protein